MGGLASAARCRLRSLVVICGTSGNLSRTMRLMAGQSPVVFFAQAMAQTPKSAAAAQSPSRSQPRKRLPVKGKIVMSNAPETPRSMPRQLARRIVERRRLTGVHVGGPCRHVRAAAVAIAKLDDDG